MCASVRSWLVTTVCFFRKTVCISVWVFLVTMETNATVTAGNQSLGDELLRGSGRECKRVRVCAYVWYKQALKTWICFIFCLVRKWNLENHKVAFHTTSDLLRPSLLFFCLFQETYSQVYFSKALKVAVHRSLVHHTSLKLFSQIPLVGLKHLQHGCSLPIGEGIVTLILLFIYWWDYFLATQAMLFLHFTMNPRTCLKEYSEWNSQLK